MTQTLITVAPTGAAERHNGRSAGGRGELIGPLTGRSGEVGGDGVGGVAVEGVAGSVDGGRRLVNRGEPTGTIDRCCACTSIRTSGPTSRVVVLGHR